MGLTLAQIEDGVVIKDIAPSFQSKDDALVAGDMIVAVDGKDVSTWPKEAILEEISGPVGGTVSISVSRKDRVLIFEVERIMLKNADSKTLRSVQQKHTQQVEPKLETSSNTAENEKETMSKKTTQWNVDTSSETAGTPETTESDTGAKPSGEKTDEDSDTTVDTDARAPAVTTTTDTSVSTSPTP